MTVATTTSTVSYLGNNATTVFPYAFDIPTTGALLVQLVNQTTSVVTVLTAGQFTATGIGLPAGGSITYPNTGSPIDTNTKIVISRITPYTQPTSLTNQQGLSLSVIEAALDWIVFQTQQLATKILTPLSLRAGDVDGSGAFDARGNRITNLAAPTATSDAARLLDLQNISAVGGNVPLPTLGQVGWVIQATATGVFGWVNALASYLTSAAAAALYLTQTTAAATYATIASLSAYLTTAAAATTYASIAVTPSAVRQTVLSGPQTAGVPSFLPATSASLSLVSQNIAAGAPLIVSVANGFGTSGNVDVVGQSTANLTWTATTAVTNYHGVTIAAGALTAFTTTLLPIYQYGGTIAITTGQYTFDVAQMKMFLGNGTTAPQVNAVFVGESVAAATTITSTTAYQYIGYYDSGFINTLPGAGTFTSKNSNLGLADQNIQLVLKNLTTDAGYVAGDQITSGLNGGVSASYPQAIPTMATRLATGFSTAAYSPIQVIQKTGGNAITLTAANWAYRVIARRAWGGA